MPRRFLLAHNITAETKANHRVRWFARVTPHDEAPDGWLPRNRWMRGRDFGWDVRCSCGWQSHTGGGIETWVQEEVDEHRWHAQWEAETCLVIERGLICVQPKGHEGPHGAESALTGRWIEWEMTP